MSKVLTGVFVGVFVGALTVKLLAKTNTGWLQNSQGKVKKGFKAAKDAFAEGYHATVET